MPFINFSKDEIQCKIVYYGCGFCGKTTNLLHIFKKTMEDVRGKMVSIDTDGDRTIFFDFLSLNLGKIRGFDIRVQLYTVPGQVHYDATRKLVLKGVDGVVFVADSLKTQREKNIESLINLAKNLAEKRLSIRTVPLVMQYNKRDLEAEGAEILPVSVLEKDLNSMLKAPHFLASALEGEGTFETLREISKLVVKDVSKKILLNDGKGKGTEQELEEEIDQAIDSLFVEEGGESEKTPSPVSRVASPEPPKSPETDLGSPAEKLGEEIDEAIDSLFVEKGGESEKTPSPEPLKSPETDLGSPAEKLGEEIDEAIDSLFVEKGGETGKARRPRPRCRVWRPLSLPRVPKRTWARLRRS
jgi:signal recognition particle receptor subunit beta